MKILIAAGMAAKIPSGKFDFVIGVDRGNVNLLAQEAKIDLAVGDFDSVSADEFANISVSADRIIKLPAKKDDTDLEVALTEALRQFPQAEIVIIGALGGRLDHMMTNFYLPISEQFKDFAEQITMINEQNQVKYFLPGRHELKQIDGMTYIGYMQVKTGASLAIENAKYPLRAEQNFKEIYASNEFLDGPMIVSIKQGALIAIYSRDKNQLF